VEIALPVNYYRYRYRFIISASERAPASPPSPSPSPERGFRGGGDDTVIPWRVMAAALLASLSFIVTRDELAKAFPPQFPAKDSFNGIV